MKRNISTKVKTHNLGLRRAYSKITNQTDDEYEKVSVETISTLNNNQGIFQKLQRLKGSQNTNILELLSQEREIVS